MADCTWKYSEPLVTKLVTCEDCHGYLELRDDRPAELTVYTREGTKFAQHFTKVCPNRWCRRRYSYGYSIKNEEKVYDKVSPTSVYLVSSNETAFKVDYLYEVTLHFLHSNATFQGTSDVYNQFHNFTRNNLTRNNLNPKRLASGFFLYGFLEMTSRCGIYPKLSTKENWLDDAILENHTKLKKVFSNIWCGSHKCKVENCETMMVSDGGMKLNRKVCAAKFSVVRKFEHSKKTVLTGCTAMPSPQSPFCSEHVKEETPVLLAEKITKRTRENLWQYRAKNQTSNLRLPNDSVFTVETVFNVRKTKDVIEYLVKFAGYSDLESCWEPAKNLPNFIVDHYKEKSNLGLPLPSPSIKLTRKVGQDSEVYHHLEWKISEHPRKELELENGETLFDLDADKLSEEELVSTCNTRKVKDKRDRRHTAGILISAKPCGIIPHVDELFVCESINQVHGSIIEFLGNLDPETRAKFKIWLFDDMCHLKPHSEKPKQADQNEITKQFANLAKAVDKFHFPGHKKTDKYCQANCNPNVELKKSNITKLNSPACEQAFKWLNAFKNLKTMNEPRHKLFLLYMIDLHNLHIEDRVDLVANPLNERRIDAIKNVDLFAIDEHEVVKVEDNQSCVDDLMFQMETKLKVTVEERLEDCFNEANGEFHCSFCPGIYKREGNIRNHLESKHNKVFKIVCSCGKIFPDSTRLCRHKKTCK